MNYPKELTETYDIYEAIGEGGGGIVYRAVHRRLKKEVVLKKIKGAASSIQDFRTEVDILKNLRHSYLPQVIDFIESAEGIYTVMDFIPGKSLQKMLDEKHKFTEKEVMKYAGQICEALGYLHKQNPPIIHGDIKPDNIMITPNGNVCLIDFNISGVFEGQGAKTMGYTPGYSSPEQIKAFEEMKCLLAAQKQNASQIQQPVYDSQATVLLEDAVSEETVLLDSYGEQTTVLLDEAAVTAEFQPRGNPGMSNNSQVPLTSSVRIDARSDVYSLGATLYTLLTGKLVNTESKKLNISKVSDGCLIILAKALEQNSSKRYANAEEMLQAVLKVNEKDKRYRRLILRQELAIVFYIALIAASAYLMVEGKRTIGVERGQRYEQLIGILEEGVENELSLPAFDESYEAAISMQPKDVAPYYARAYYLYETEGVKSALKHMEQVMELSLTGSKEVFGNLYYLYAECNFQVEEYGKAHWAYTEAMEYQPDNPLVYRDCAISLVYLGRVSEAEELLAYAKGKGMQQTDINMVRGEIARMSGAYEEALKCFEQVIANAQDDYLLQRAYIMASKAYAGIGTVEALQSDVIWLKEAVQRLSTNNRMLIYESMVQDYIRLGEMTGENSCYENAIAILNEVIKMGWDSYLTHSNIVVLYQRMGNYEAAKTSAVKMSEQYPEHYVSYMRLAFTEVELQNRVAEDSRDYGQFVTYYKQAKEYAKKQLSGNVTDNEMLLLDNVYRQLTDGGWITE